MSGNWVYRVTVAPEKTDAFIDALATLGLIDDDALEILRDPDDEEWSADA